MNILMLGTGKGSYTVRGKQLGAALGARVRSEPHLGDLLWADVVVLIKRAGPMWAAEVQQAGKPIIWDALDYWKQPDENAWEWYQAEGNLLDHLIRIKPAIWIGATETMADSQDGIYLPHHARPGLKPRPVRDRIEIVAYEGTRKYLGRWGKAITDECERRGWIFVINPLDLSVADLIVAFRDGEHDGWMCREWKSGVKLVNAMAAGRPIITQPSSAMCEINPDGTVIDDLSHLSSAFDLWSDRAMREGVARASVSKVRPYLLPDLAARYRVLLDHALTMRSAA